MLILALDACAPTHAKGLASNHQQFSGLRLLHELSALDVRLITTKGIYGELVDMSLQATLLQWTSSGLLHVEKATSQAVKTLDNRISRRVARPGRRDRGLAALQQRLRGSDSSA